VRYLLHGSIHPECSLFIILIQIGSVFASDADRIVLGNLQEAARKAGLPIQESSQVVLPDGSVFKFTPTNANTLRR
jgi:hypothetical protein